MEGTCLGVKPIQKKRREDHSIHLLSLDPAVPEADIPMFQFPSQQILPPRVNVFNFF